MNIITCDNGTVRFNFYFHCVRSAQVRSYFWSECGKIQTRKNSVFGHFHAAAIFTSGVLFIVTIPKFSIELENGPIKQVQNVAEKIKEEFVKLPSQHFLV